MTVQYHKCNDLEGYKKAVQRLRKECSHHGYYMVAGRMYSGRKIEAMNELHHFFLPDGTELGMIGFDGMSYALDCVTIFDPPRVWGESSIRAISWQVNPDYDKEIWCSTCGRTSPTETCENCQAIFDTYKGE